MPLSDCLSLGLAIVTIFLAGAVVFYGVVRQPERFFRVERIAYCYPLGMTALSLLFFAMSFFGIGLRVPLVVGAVVISAVVVRRCRTATIKEFWLRPATVRINQARFDEFEWFLVLIVVACLGARTIACLLTPLWDWDSLNNWGIRSKLLYLGTVRSYDDYFRGAEYRYLNQTYPLLWPFMYAWLCTALGRWDDISMMAINPFNLIVFSLLIFYTVRKFASRKVALGITVMVASLPTSIHYTECGQADIALMLLSGASLFCLVTWMQEGRRDFLILAGVLMGGALFTKTEGQVVFGAQLCMAAVSILVSVPRPDRKRRFGQLVVYAMIAVALVSPWLLYRSTLSHDAWMVGGRVLNSGIRWQEVPTLLVAIIGNAYHFYNQYGLPKWNILWVLMPLFLVFSRSSRQYPWLFLVGIFLLHGVCIMVVELMSKEILTLHQMEAAYERYVVIMLPPLWLVLGKCVDEWWTVWQSAAAPQAADISKPN